MSTKVPTGHAAVGLLEGVVDGTRDIVGPVDGRLLGTEEGILEGCIDKVGREDGLDVAEGTDDGQVFPIRIDISSEVKCPPSWMRVEPKNNL